MNVNVKGRKLSHQVFWALNTVLFSFKDTIQTFILQGLDKIM